MAELTHLACPYEFCGSSDAFAYNEEKMVGCCYSCGTPYPSKLKVFDWAAKEYPTKSKGYSKHTEVIEEDMKKEYRDWRGVTARTMRFYDVETDIDEAGKEIRHGYKYPDGKVKYRIFPKTFTADVGLKTDVFWGMNRFNGGSARAVTICEGEGDTLSAFQMLGSKYPVVSLPSATPKRTILENCYEWLNSFDKIYLSIDTDDKAENFAIALMNLFPGRVYKVNHDKYKDANEFLQAGAAASYVSAWQNARLYTPENFTSSPEEWEKVLQQETPYSYVSTPVPELNKLIRGFIKGGITILKALPGTGKTDIFRYWQHDLVANKGARVAVLHMEEMKSTTGRGLVTYDLKKNVRTREDAENSGVTEATVLESMRALTEGNKFISFDINANDPIESTLSCIRSAISIYNVDYIFIDHLQRLAYLAGTENATNSLTELAVKLVDLTKRNNVGIIAISHVNENGAAKYAKAIEEEAIVVLEVERDRFSDNPIAKNTTRITVSKNRPFSLVGEGGSMYYDPDTTTIGPSVEGF